MVHLLQTGFFLLLAGFTYAFTQTEKCPVLDQDSLCECRDDGFISVTCRNIEDLATLKEEIKSFHGYHIDSFTFMELNVPYLPAGLFSGISIEYISLRKSLLGNIYSPESATPSPFQGLENSLKTIYIRDTKEPSKWYWPDMKNFTKFRSIAIQSSPTNFVGRNFAEIGGGSLENVVFQGSQVNRIHPQAFQDVTNLRYVNFANNNLPYLVRTMFPNPAPKLRILIFSQNRLFTLNENMFENMPALNILDLAKNEFKKFESVVFKPVWNQLGFFYISDNPFECDCTLAPLKERLLSRLLPDFNDGDQVECINHEDNSKTKLRHLDTNALQCY